MKAKKLLAIVTAVALIALPVQVAFAADPADQIVTGDATVNYVDPTSKISLVLPTSSALAFTLDPQNLAATQGVGEWKPEDGGSIIPAAVNIVANKSAVPIKTTVNFTLEDEAGNVVLLDSSAGVNDGTDKNMYLSLVPASAKTSIAQDAIDETTDPVFVQDGEGDAEFAEADLLAAGAAVDDLLAYDAGNTAEFGQFVETAEDSGLFNQVQVPVHGDIAATTQTSVSAYSTLGVSGAAAVVEDADTGTSLAYVMDKADYYVVKSGGDYDLTYDGAARNGNYDTASFIISGLINKNADWSGYDADTKISVTATYSFEVLTDAAYDTAVAAKVDETYNSVETVAPDAPAISEESFVIEADTAEDVAVTLGTGSLAATGVASVTYEDEGTQTLTVTDDYAFSGTTLTFTSDYVNSLITGSVASRTYTVTFNNSAHTTDTVTLTYDAVVDAAPSIETTSYTIVDNTALPVTVSLGSGDLAATGVSSVTYLNSSGVAVPLTTSYYTFADNTLTFVSSYIHTLYGTLAAPRTYTVHFNDTASTTVAVTLSK